MDRRSARSSAATGPSWRKHQQVPQYTYAQGVSPAQPNGLSSWRSRQDPTAVPKELPFIDEDGFTAVSKRDQSGKEASSILMPCSGNAAPTPITKAQTIALRAVRNPSAAAVDRGSVYTSRGKVLSGYKQSCLPPHERDPILAELQRQKGSKLSKENFKPGMIIRAAHHEQDFTAGGAAASDATTGDKYRTDSRFGTIYTKYRKMIVVALYQDHYVAVPLYTHNGKGLEHKQLQADEFVSVQDHRAPGAFKALSVHQPIVTEQVNAGVEPYHVKSTAHFTYPVSRRYGLPVVVEGHVRKVSLKSLAALVNTYAARATR